ncbi:MAG: hypothetical protein R6W75_00795, partial [Smithellaceae bacterium]
MKTHRLFTLMTLVVLALFFAGCARLPLIADPPAPPAPASTVAEEPAETPDAEGLPTEPVLVRPEPQPVDRNAIGCVLPLSGRFTDTGGKALDAFLLSAGLFDARFQSPW